MLQCSSQADVSGLVMPVNLRGIIKGLCGIWRVVYWGWFPRDPVKCPPVANSVVGGLSELLDE